MICEPLPKKYDKVFRLMRERGAGWLPPSFPGLGINEKLAELDSAARKADPVENYPNDVAGSQDQYFSAIGIILADTLADELGWELAWVRRPGEGIVDGVLSVVDRDRSYKIEPIAVVHVAGLSGLDACQSVYGKVMSGTLPEVSDGSFHVIRP